MSKTIDRVPQTIGGKVGGSLVESKMRQNSLLFFGRWGKSDAKRAFEHRAPFRALLKPMAARAIVREQRNPGGNDVQGIARRADHAVSRP
jgi:hypothetical protein